MNEDLNDDGLDSPTRRALLLTVVGVIATVVESTVVANAAVAATRTTKRASKTTKAPSKATTSKTSTTVTTKPGATKAGAGVQETKVQVLPVPQVVIDDLATYVGGVWRGNWLDRQGRKGVSTMEFTVDKSARTARIAVSVGGATLGVAGVASEKVEIVLDGRASVRTVDSRTFGVATMEEAELSSWRARVRDIPGGVLTSIDALAFPGDRGSLHLSYEATLRDGTRHECTHAWSRDGAVLAAFRTAQSAGAAGAIASGSAATMLITEQEASAIVGEPMGPPKNNGGKLGFAPGVDASNGEFFGPSGNSPRPGQICAGWTVYLAKDRETAEAFWESFKRNYSLQPRFQLWPGVGDEALAEPGFPGTYVFKGRSVLAFQQLYPCANDRTLEPGVAAQWARKIVETMVSRLP